MNKAIPITLLVFNAVGIFFYIKNASLAWAIPEEAGLDPAIAGPSMVWGLGALPILLLFLIIDGIWWTVVVSRQQRKWAAVMASCLWAAAIAVDFWHH